MKLKNTLYSLLPLFSLASNVYADPIQFSVLSYTANSFTFELNGAMPTTSSTTLSQPTQLDIEFTGNLWQGGETFPGSAATGSSGSSNTISVTSVFNGDGGIASISHTGGYGGFATGEDYSFIGFNASSIAGLTAIGTPVTVSFPTNFFGQAVTDLNTSGTGSFDLYWGNVSGGNGSGNQLLASEAVVNGQIVSAVPVPGAVWLFSSALAGFGLMRQRTKTA